MIKKNSEEIFTYLTLFPIKYVNVLIRKSGLLNLSNCSTIFANLCWGKSWFTSIFSSTIASIHIQITPPQLNMQHFVQLKKIIILKKIKIFSRFLYDSKPLSLIWSFLLYYNLVHKCWTSFTRLKFRTYHYVSEFLYV